MPYWECFLLTGAAVSGIFGVIGVGQWIEEHKPKWLDLYLIIVFSALFAVLPYMMLNFGF